MTPSACPSVHAPRINTPRIRRRRQKLRASAPCARPGPDRILFTSRPGRCCRRLIFPLFVCFSVLLFIACGLPISWCSFSRCALSAHTGASPRNANHPPLCRPGGRNLRVADGRAGPQRQRRGAGLGEERSGGGPSRRRLGVRGNVSEGPWDPGPADWSRCFHTAGRGRGGPDGPGSAPHSMAPTQTQEVPGRARRAKVGR